MKYIVQTYLNYGPGMLAGYQPGDLLVRGPLVIVEAESEAASLEAVWQAGNIGTQWSSGPRRLRSLSTGDVLVVADQPESRPYTIDSWGFSLANRTAMKISLNPRLAKVKDTTRGFWTNDPGPFPPEPIDYSFDYDPSQTSL